MILVNSGKETLLDLAEKAHDQSISIFIPTHRRGKQVNERQDQIAFKNHVQTVRLALEARMVRSNDIDDLVEPMEALLDNPQFWRHQRKGLAVFRNPDHFSIFHSPIPFTDSSRLDSRFHLQPLLPFVQAFTIYYILQIGKNGVSLYQADPFSITLIDIAEVMPSGLDAITQYYDFEEELQGRTKGRGGMAAVYTSDDSNEDQKAKDHLLADYFRLVNEGIIKLMGTQNAPLLLASVAYYQPIYQQVNTYPYLHEGGITGNFDHVKPEDMHEMANERLSKKFNETQQQRINQYQNSLGSDLVSSDLRQLLEAAVTGRIEVLFLEEDTELWGQFDEVTLATTIHDEQLDGDESLIEKVALLTLRHGGEVYVLDKASFPDSRNSINITALYRF
ncbi:baeRF7 domain-containing protein [Spirosoma pulveris]